MQQTARKQRRTIMIQITITRTNRRRTRTNNNKTIRIIVYARVILVDPVAFFNTFPFTQLMGRCHIYIYIYIYICGEDINQCRRQKNSRIQSRGQKGTQNIVKRPQLVTIKSSGALVWTSKNNKHRRIYWYRLEALKTIFLKYQNIVNRQSNIVKYNDLE